MSLQVWLPLNGNLNNYGLSGLKFSTLSTNTAVNSDGKIGQCYTNDSLSAGGLISNETIDLGQNQSMFCWFKFTTLSSGSSLGGGIVSQHRYESNQGMGITIKYVSSTTGYLSVNTGNGSSRTFNSYCGTTLLQANTWYHGGYTYDGSNIRIYVNGVLEKTQAYTGMLVPADYLTVFCWSMASGSGNSVYGNFKLNGSINDVRVYNHCLSQQEIKEISKALVLHYKLTEKSCGGTSVNLVANGWGGLDNWTTPANVSTTEIPSDVTPVPTHSYRDNISKQFILIKNPRHTYTMSAYVKIYGSNTLSYLALIPYDVDKKQINWFNCSAAFKTDSLTTLRTDLNPGDTVIYLDTNTDMSTWTNTSRYYGHVAIFGYTDSTGYIYDDLFYTQRVYRYRGTGSTFDANENINVTNKTITLKAAYNGQTIPAGTRICLTCEGAAYYYPKTISASLSTDWVLLTQSFIPSEVPYIKAAKYFKVRSMSHNWIAAITLVDNNDNNIVYDDSGYGNNGTITGNLSAINDSPRYNHSIEFLQGSKVAKSLRVDKHNWTIAFWMNCDWTDTSVSSAQMIRWNSGYIFIRKQTTTRRLIIYYYYWNSSNESKSIYAYIMSASNVPTSRAWIHCAATFDGTTIRTYFNGTYKNSSTLPEGATLRNESANGTFSVHYTSSEIADIYSDIRVYATTLSADDIKELYNSRANIDNTGNLSCYEFSELEGSHNMIIDPQISIVKKVFTNGLGKYTQANCQVTLIDEGYRIYRTPNTNYDSSDSSTRTMWGGFVLDNTGNRFNLQDNHTYILTFDIKGKSSNAVTNGQIYWTHNNVGNSTVSSLIPNPTGIVRENPVVENYNSNEWKRFYYKFTISDGLYKVCSGSTLSAFTNGNTYLSYKQFKYGFGYQSTGELGTDLIINNLAMIDITDGTTLVANISKEGIFEMTYGYENHYSCFFNKNKDINANQLLEI